MVAKKELVKNKEQDDWQPNLTVDNLNPNIVGMQYVILGPHYYRSIELVNEVANGVKKPFTEVIKANVGDGQAMGQIPITFIREVCALIMYPTLLEDKRFADDVKEKARTILASCQGGSVGAYTEKTGIEMIRRHVAEYIERRDGGVPSDWRDVILAPGATSIIVSVLRLLVADVDGKKPGVMTPIPQYPLYSASLAELNMQQIDYYLDETKQWGLNLDELSNSITEAKKHCNPRAIVVINPGNPTGQVLTEKNIQEIIKFAYKERLIILADEVYQDNVYAEGSAFHSVKKVLFNMGSPYNKMEVASFMSCSKGYIGECGLRGGYVEIINLLPEVKAMYLKAVSAMTCPSSIGQAVLECVVNPPRAGDPSYRLFSEEKTRVLEALRFRAKMVADTFNSIDGMSCNEVQGAMYAFPQLNLPQKAIEAAEEACQSPDTFYAFALMEKTGICIVPGHGFGQAPGTHHFRTTILPQTEKLLEMLEKFRIFHKEFLDQYK